MIVSPGSESTANAEVQMVVIKAHAVAVDR
jgi:hypothetical protein